MHELAVTESILEISLRHANQANAKRITNLYLVIGQFASIVDDSVQFYWDIVSKETIAAGCHASLQEATGNTGHVWTAPINSSLAGDGFSCPNCSSDHVKVVSGDEFYMEAIDVET